MKVCPSCQRKYSDDIAFCPSDGSKLNSVENKPQIFTGQILEDKFEVVEGMDLQGRWEVYSGEELSTQRPIVIRVVSRSVKNENLLKRFQERMPIVQKISYPGVAKVISFGVTNEKRPYVISEKIVGNSLQKALQQMRSLSLPLSLSIIQQVLQVLQVAHENKLWHLNLQPSKIILLNDDSSAQFVKVVGLGEEYLFPPYPEELSETIALEANNYTPPELLANKVSLKSDLYSLGVIAYQMITGVLPFPSGVLLAKSQVFPRPAPMKRVKPNLKISRRLEKVILRSLSWRPEKRPSWETLLKEVQSAQKDNTLRVAFVIMLVVLIALFVAAPYRQQLRNFWETLLYSTTQRERAPLPVKSPEKDKVLMLAPEEKFAKEKQKITPYSEPWKLAKNMRYIPSGEVTIGSSQGDADEKPVRVVTVEAFYLDPHEVTNQQYWQFIQETGHKPPAYWKNNRYPQGRDKHPVVQVSWFDASLYAYWAGKRLPTEIEWEKAARALYDDKEVPSPIEEWRKGEPPSPQFANFDSEDSKPVGSYRFSGDPKELVDLAGNVWEWTDSWYDPILQKDRVIRGGSFQTNAYQCRVSYRDGFRAHLSREDIGFRCAKSP